MNDTPEPGTAEPAAEAAANAAPVAAPIGMIASAAEQAPAEEGYGRRLELILEALLLAADTPLPLEQMQKLVAAEFNLGRKDLRAALERLGERYAETACELREVASGWRLQVRAEYGEWVGRLWQEKPPKYSRALLETLALIVYRQPITRGEIEDVRGVAVSTNILRTLLERGWVREVGHKEVPGRPALYGTAAQFLDDFNLRSLDQLPALPEIKDLDQLEAALKRLGQGSEALAELRAEQEAAEHPLQAGAALPEAEQTSTEPAELGADESSFDQPADDEPVADEPGHEESVLDQPPADAPDPTRH
jgi:segregation and condensation protein B